MADSNMLDEIREANLSYLLLAQKLIREDKPQALYRLGLSEEVAYAITGLTTAQILKIASASMLICRFSFDDEVIWNLLTSYSKDKSIAGVHAAILMAGQMVEA
jgi:flagellar transcriptional activator FlhD